MRWSLHDARRRDAPPRTSPLQPPNSGTKWWIGGAVAMLLLLWELASHRWAMGLSMATRHGLDVLIGGGVTAVTVVAYLSLAQRYEQRLSAGAQLLWDLDQRLRGIMADRGDRLLRIARDLRVAEREVVCRCAGGAARGSDGAGGPAPGNVGDPLETLNAKLEQLEELAREETAAANLSA